MAWKIRIRGNETQTSKLYACVFWNKKERIITAFDTSSGKYTRLKDRKLLKLAGVIVLLDLHLNEEKTLEFSF